MINRILCIFFISTFVWAECNEGEVDLGWGDALGSQGCNEFWSGHSDGCMPSGCYSIEETTEIRLNYDQIIGVIPPEIGNLINLQSLYLENNDELTGEIPSEIGNLTNLTVLRLAFCSLTGEIPSELGNLTNLEMLHFYDNQLTGEIPPELGNLTNTTYFDLSNNNLTGEIPPEIGNLNLAIVSLVNNQLSGVIPPSVCNANYIHVSGNQLCPPYPECISDDNIENQDTTNCQEPCDDVDADGICDDEDDCVGEYDECGVCNGDGIADGACDCDGNVEDCNGECGGDILDGDEDGICDDIDACFGINDIDGDGWLDDEDGDGLCDDVDPCFGFASEAYYDEWSEQWFITEDNMDGDEYCDDADACVGINDMDGDGWLDDEDGDGICDDLDPCFGAANGAWYNHEEDALDIYSDNMDGDEYCDDADACVGINDMDGDGWTDDQDGDGICDDLDPCFGSSNSVWYNEEEEELEIYSDNADGDEYCDDADACLGINDMDGDGWADDQDGDGICDDLDPCFGAANYWQINEEYELEIIADNADGDEYCDDADACLGINDMDGDSLLDDFDGDGICDDLDPCFGWDNEYSIDEDGNLMIDSNDEDEDGICNDVDACFGFDNYIDEDGCLVYNDDNNDGYCNDMLASDIVYIPEEYSMSSAYPNPFNPATNFQYEIPEYSMVDIYIYDISGRVVEQLISSYHSPGVYNILWDASNHASGMYILFIKSNDFINSQKISLTK